MRTLFHVDAFTTEPFSGNAAGVVLDADGLTDAEMLSIAAELKHSETAFVSAPDGDDHDLVVRFFTPTVEVPACGHATVATHVARTRHFGLPSHALVQRTGTGLVQPITVNVEADEITVTMDQGTVSFDDALHEGDLDALLRALGLGRVDLLPDLRPTVAGTGVPMALVPVRSRGSIDRLTPDFARLDELAAVLPRCVMVFTLDTGDRSVLTHSRMFAPAIGIDEDPVTGMAHGPLGALLAREGVLDVRTGPTTFRGRQGVAMGRQGEIDVTVSEVDGAYSAAITGGAAVVYQAELRA